MIRQNITVIIRLEDFETESILSEGDAEVYFAHSGKKLFYKSEGYFIGQEDISSGIIIKANGYDRIALDKIPQVGKSVMRISMLRSSDTTNVFSPPISEGEIAYIAIQTEKSKDIILEKDVEAGDTEIFVQRRDLRDISDMWHIICGSSRNDSVFLCDSFGYGKYQMMKPSLAAYKARETFLLPFRRVVCGSNGRLDFPIPKDFIRGYWRIGDMGEIESIMGGDI